MKVNLKVGNIADNLNGKEFAVTVRGLRDHFTTFMKRYKSKTRQEVKGSNSLKTYQRDLKKVNAEPKQILKRNAYYTKSTNP